MGVRSINNSLQQFLDTFVRSGTDASLAASADGLVATGGIISEYTEGSTVYRAHIFTSTGTFNVTSIGGYGSNVEYLLVAGGGAGGSGNFRLCGGGGAGGLLSNHPDVPASAPTGATRQAAYPVSPGPYTVSIGAGGAGATNGTIVDGSASNFYPTPVSYPSPTYLRAFGGGGGGGNPNPGSNGGNNTSGNPGGSGGGNTEGGPATFAIGGGGSGTTGQGSNGGRTGSGWGGAGGGGAGEAGCQDDNGNIPANPPGAYENGGYGGDGMQVRIAGPTSATSSVGTPGTNPGGGYFAGGGGGSYQPSTNAPLKGIGGEGGGGYGIIWPGNVNPFGQDGLSNTGGGGGGAAEQTGPGRGGNGGSGVAVIRYQINSIPGTAKATGGAISYFGGKTIHTFTSTGTFASLPTWSPSTSVEYVVVAGGGGGGETDSNNGTGGAGAGGYLTGTTPFSGPFSFAVNIGAGGAGNVNPSGGPGFQGTPSSAVFPTGTVTSTGGGAGSHYGPTPTGATWDNSGNGGSGGGAGGYLSSTPVGAGTNFPGPTQQGYPGGSGAGTTGIPGRHAGGGGGAGAAGTPGPSGGAGGVGLQVPTTFRNPEVAPSDTSNPQPSQRGGGLGTPGPGGSFYLAGGGGGAQGNPVASAVSGGSGGGGASGQSAVATSGLVNTGGGAGGGNNNQTLPGSATGGSGIVLIAYPS